MSYILDALRRADAERERDPARGIHAQPTAGAPARARPRIPGWTWPALGAVLVAAAVAVRFQQPAAPPVSTPLHPRTLAPVPAPAVVPVATTVTPAAPPVLPLPQKVRVVAATAAAPLPVKAASAASVAAAASTPAPAPVAPVAAPASSNERVYNVAELPADVQQGLPKLAISGGVYSDNAAQRMLVVGGQVVNEGAELAPGVVLEQIRARAAVLRFRGYRYSVAY